MFSKRKSGAAEPDREFSSAHPLDESKIGDLVLPRLAVQPPAVFASTLMAGAAIDHFLAPMSLGLGWPGAIAGLVLGVSGVALAMWSMQAYRRAASSPDPNHMPSTLVTTGPYRRTRNPIYLGSLLMVAGIGIGANVPWILVLTVIAAFVVHYGIVLREEAYLEHVFGQRYLDFKSRVRRWV